MPLRSPSRTALAALALALASGCASRDEYPSRPILLVCPWSAGGGTDRVSRQVAVLLEQELGTPVNVINATGGSGVTGHTRGSLAPPDGYTIAMITVELNMLHWRGLTSITHRDFQPLMQLNRDDAALFVRADAPWKTLGDLERAVRERPRSLKASGTAQGGIWHVSLAGWLDATGLKADDITWISINGAGPSLQELLSGGVQVVCCSLPEAQTLLEAGEVRCLGLMGDAREPGYPDVPTFREQGYDWAIGGWRGLALPLGVPRDRVDRLVAALERVVASDEYRHFMETAGFRSAVEGPAAFSAALEGYDAQFGEILERAAFRSVRRSRFGPYVFPALLASALAATMVYLALSGGLARAPSASPWTAAGLGRVALAVGWVVAFAAVVETVGYVLTGTVLLAALMLTLRTRPILALGVPLVLVPLTYQVFAVGLGVPLPWGWLGW